MTLYYTILYYTIIYYIISYYSIVYLTLLYYNILDPNPNPMSTVSLIQNHMFPEHYWVRPKTHSVTSVTIAAEL